MVSYTFLQWILFFAIYCIIGWIFETTYVSIKSLKFTNRGFLYGPCLPIYGSGVIIMLFLTFPFRDNFVLTYILSLVGATLLEYLTGVVMEAIFKVKYWDYSYKKIQYKGYICLSSSIAWGFFGVIIVNVVNKPIERFVLSLSHTTCEFLAIAFVLIFTADFTLSVREAINIRDEIKRFIRDNEEVAKLKATLEDALLKAKEGKAELVDNLVEMKVIYELRKEALSSYMASLGGRIKSLRKRHPSFNIRTHISEIINMLK